MSDDVDVTRSVSPGHPSGRPFRVGDLVAGRFRIVRQIAEGGMGIVYEAIDEKLNERRAIKCAKPGYGNRLSPEARISLRVTHPNVCRVFEIHTVDTPLGPIDFLTMEFIDGRTLSHELRERGRLPEAEARRIARQICAGVEAAHAQSLLHRDLKSKNVLLTKDAQGRTRAVVTDFGIAKETSPTDEPSQSGISGTPAYLALERWRGGSATVASDIFALGIVLHELVSGHRPGLMPGGGRDIAPDVPRPWRQVIARCVDPDPRRRYASAAAVADALADRARWKRVTAWTAVAAAPMVFVAWPFLFPAPIAARLAILALEAGDGSPPTAALARGVSADLSSHLMRLRPRPPQLVVIPLEETHGVPADDVGLARTRLGASHVLRATVTRQGDQLLLRGAIVDTTTKLTFAERSGAYPAADPGAVVSTLSALVASAFRLPRQTTAERVAPAAYAPYVAGIAALDRGPAAYAEAAEAFSRAMAIDPDSVLPRARLAEAYYRGWVATGDTTWLTRGREELSRAERLNPDSIAVRLAAGRLNLVPGGYVRAAAEFRRATELDPTSQEAWDGLARAYQEIPDVNAAAAAFTKAIELQPGYYRPLNDFGDFYRQLGNYAEAEKLWLRVVDVAPGLIFGHANLGALYTQMGRYADAERELSRALAIDPRYRAVLNNLGALFQFTGRDADAVRQFEQARVIGPETYVLWLNLGDSYRRLGRSADAEAAYRRGHDLAEPILLKNPSDAVTRAFVAYFALRLGDRVTAERELTQALNSGGENSTVKRRAILCYEALGSRDRALAVLESAPPDLVLEIARQPDVRALRDDPRFTALLPKTKPT